MASVIWWLFWRGTLTVYLKSSVWSILNCCKTNTKVDQCFYHQCYYPKNYTLYSLYCWNAVRLNISVANLAATLINYIMNSVCGSWLSISWYNRKPVWWIVFKYFCNDYTIALILDCTRLRCIISRLCLFAS